VLQLVLGASSSEGRPSRCYLVLQSCSFCWQSLDGAVAPGGSEAVLCCEYHWQLHLL
jgi:hypothetical protein